MGSTLTLSADGDLLGDRLSALLETLEHLPPETRRLELDLAEADLDDDPNAVATLAAALRRSARRLERLRLHRPPQVLAHTLYRVGALTDGRLEILDPRSEIGLSG